jgi:hypothetical protein
MSIEQKIKRIAVCCLVAVNFGFSAFAQLPSALSEYNVANTAKSEYYLSDQEKKVIALINLARIEPNIFIEQYLKKAEPDTNRLEVASAIKMLRANKDRLPFLPVFSLHKSALLHARDMGVNGKIGTESSSGVDFENRIHQFFPQSINLSENFYVGSGEPVDIVVSQLTGKNDPEFRHRDNLLSTNLHYIGISIQPHKVFCANAVIDFAKKPEIITGDQPRSKKKVNIYWKDCPPATKVATKKSGNVFSNMFKKKKRLP